MKVKFPDQKYGAVVSAAAGTDGANAEQITLPELQPGEAYLLRKVTVTLYNTSESPQADDPA